MTAPRVEIDLDKIRHNASMLVEVLSDRGISVTGVTKAALGSPVIARTLLQAGVSGLGDSRLENVATLRRARIRAPITLIRSPMMSRIEQVVELADISFNTELDVISKLSAAARQAGTTHGIVLMVELGDLREGVMPDDLAGLVRRTLRLPNLILKGIGANLACRCGVAPDAKNMGELSALAESIEAAFGLSLDIVSGGNSANLAWALSGADVGRINNLRLGESILLGCEPLHRQLIPGLYADAVTLVAEVIESNVKPSAPWGEIGQTAFGKKALSGDRGRISQAILAVGRQDVDPSGLKGPLGLEVLAASSDHIVVNSGNRRARVGEEIAFQLNYSALLRAMTSPFVAKVFRSHSEQAASAGVPTRLVR